MSPLPAALRDLPRLRTRDLGSIGTLLRPGTQSSPLTALGPRFLATPPGFPPVLVTSDPGDVRDLFGNHDDFSIGQVLTRFSSHDRMFGGQALIFLDGDEHRRERRILTPPFQNQAVRAYEPHITAAVHRALPQWPVGEPFAFLNAAYRLVLDILLETTFGELPADRRTRLAEAIRAWLDEIASRGFLALTALTPLLGGFTPPYPPLTRKQAAVDALVVEEITARRAAPGDDDTRTDVLFRYMRVRAASGTDEILARDVRGVLLAAYETTSITLGWIAAMLTAHPNATAELDAAADAGDRDRLDTYLDAVITETMRLRPVSPYTARRALRDTALNGVRVPRGTVVVIPILVIHESPDNHPDPLEFRPERFLGERPQGHTWLTFGAGAHRCLGAQFALAEAHVVFRALLEHRRIASTAGPVEPPRRFHTGLSPAADARITLLPR